MHRLAVILSLVLTVCLVGCASLRQPADTAASSPTFPPPAPGQDPPTAQPNTPPVGAEISDDPIVRLANRLIDGINGDDGTAALQIASLPDNQDKALSQCIVGLRNTTLQQHARDLAHAKDALRDVAQILPVKPVGPLSTIAEARRVRRDIESGHLKERLDTALHGWHVQLRAFAEEFNLACGAALNDTKTLAARAATVLAGGGL